MVPRSIVLFLLAALAEIGGYLMWQWWRQGRPWSFGLIGAAVLMYAPRAT